MVRIEAAIARLPPYAVLALIAVPFVVGRADEARRDLGSSAPGGSRPGFATLVAAYGATFFLVERIFEAGRGNLMTIAWFAAASAPSAGLRDVVMARLRALPFAAAARRLCAAYARRGSDAGVFACAAYSLERVFGT